MDVVGHLSYSALQIFRAPFVSTMAIPAYDAGQVSACDALQPPIGEGPLRAEIGARPSEPAFVDRQLNTESQL
jgi:hypothetical protein